MYRHELKYPVTQAQIICLESRVRSLMEPDGHLGGKRTYCVRSVYFDDRRNSCFHENEDGVSPREKFRIRIYDADPGSIHLELKRKEHGMTLKSSCSLSVEQCTDILCGRMPGPVENMSPIYGKFLLQWQQRLLRPKVIVEYDRMPFVYRPGNVRVTFDLRIRSSDSLGDFFCERIPSRPILPEGMHLMEVKYDAFLPDPVYAILQMEDLQASTFSKYYLCRKYNMGGQHSHGL